MPPRIFKAVQGADEVCVHDVTGAAVVPGMNGRLGRTLDQHIGRGKVIEILGIANVAVNESDAASAQPRQRQFAAASMQIVEARYCRSTRPGQHQRETRPDEAGSAGD